MDVLARGNEALERLEHNDRFRRRWRATYAMKTYNFPEVHPQSDGPWRDEPDKAQWIDTVTDLDCLAVRNHVGAWCGYVGVQPGHKWHGVNYFDIKFPLTVHGGLTFSNFCAEGEGTEEGRFICHIPAPGRPDNVWWLGFDCAHPMDLRPRDEEIEKELGLPPLAGLYGRPPVYRDFKYVQSECAGLALQIRDAAR